MVSIVLSTYNRAHTLKSTLDSILAQTYQDFELIVVDDGSEDDTARLLAAYDDSRIQVHTLQENIFYCAAANYGIDKAKGDLIAFATSDDVWEPQKLELQVAYLEERPKCAACFTFSAVIDEEGERAEADFEMLSGLLIQNFHTRKEWIQQLIFEGNCLCHPSAVVRRAVLEEVGGYNLMYCQSADLDLWIRIIRRYSIHVIEKCLVCYRCYRNPKKQISGADELKAARFLNEHMIIRKNFINSLTDEEMIEFFGDCFQNPDAAGHREIEIEKAFLLMKCAPALPNFRILGIEKFEELLRDTRYVRILREKYQVRLQDIYEWNREHFYVDFGIHVRMAEQDRRILRLWEEQRKDRQYIDALQRYRNTLADQINSREASLRELREKQESEREAWAEDKEKLLQKNDQMREQLQEAERKLQTAERQLGEQEKARKDAEELLEKLLLQKLEKEERRKWSKYGRKQ